MESINGVSMTQQGAALPLSKAATAAYAFPAHSMSAIEFSAARREVAGSEGINLVEHTLNPGRTF